MSETPFVDGARVHYVSVEGGDWYCVGKGGVTGIVLNLVDGIPWITASGDKGPIASVNGLYAMRINYEPVE